MCISMPKTGTAAYLIVSRCLRVRAHFKLTPYQYLFMGDHVLKRTENIPRLCDKGRMLSH